MAKKILIYIIGAIVVLLMLSAIAFSVFYATNGFSGTYTTFVTTVNGDNILKSQSVSLASGTQIKVTSFSSYSVAIYADETDGCTYTDEDGIEYDFTDLSGADLTAGFDIDYNGNKFTITYGKLSEIISTALGEDVTMVSGSSSANFTLVITSGKSTLNLTFSIKADHIPSITISPEYIVF